LRTYRPAIKLLGLFDTVSSVFVSGKWFPQLLTLPFTRRNPSVEWVRHAMAINEGRTMFNPLPWVMGQPYWRGPFKPAQSKPQNVMEVWFSGVHGDVGGGYRERESSAIKIPLAWMISQTGTMGLDYSAPTVDELVFGRNLGKPYLLLDALAPLHASMTVPGRCSNTSRAACLKPPGASAATRRASTRRCRIGASFHTALRFINRYWIEEIGAPRPRDMLRQTCHRILRSSHGRTTIPIPGHNRCASRLRQRISVICSQYVPRPSTRSSAAGTLAPSAESAVQNCAGADSHANFLEICGNDLI
jgi:hypothetical protein